MNEGRTVLITGGCGFVGVNLAASISQSYRTVRVLDNLSIGSLDALKAVWPSGSDIAELEFVQGDVRDLRDVKDAVLGVDKVVHLAAQSGVATSIEDPGFDHSINVLGTLNVLEASRLSEVRRVVFSSSNASAGEQEPPVTESGTPRPVSPYGASKLAAEGYCSAYHESFGLDTVALRFANAYGPHSTHKTSAVAQFLSKVFADAPLTIYGDGTQTRDFVYIEDLCQAIGLALGDVQSGVYQVGTGAETSVNELISTLETISGKELVRKHVPIRRGEVKRMFLDITKARKQLGYDPKFRLSEGLERTYSWFLDQSERSRAQSL